MSFRPSPHRAARVARAREVFVEVFGETAVPKREAEIAALPVVERKGRRLHTLRCHGDFGKGPHDVNVPPEVLWSLISFERFRCPYHC